MNNIQSIVVGEGVTSLENGALKSMPRLEKLDLGKSSVKAIPPECCKNCISLTRVDNFDSVTEIGAESFSGCAKLTAFQVNGGVTLIGDRAFSNSGLADVKFQEPADGLKIGTAAFEKTGLTGISFPANCESVAEDVLSGCANLTAATILGGLDPFDGNSLRGSRVKKISFGSVSKSDIAGSSPLPTYTRKIMFNGNGETAGVTPDIYLTQGQAWECPDCEYERTGYVFAEYWQTASGEKYYPNTQYAYPAQSFTLYAAWEQPHDNYHTVSFDGNGSTSGSTSAVQTDAAGVWSCPSCGYERTGYAFAGYWTTAADGSGDKYQPGVEYPSQSDLLLFAAWKEKEKTQTVVKAIISLSDCGREIGRDPKEIYSMLYQSGLTDADIYNCIGAKCTEQNILGSIQDALKTCDLLLFFHASHGSKNGHIQLHSRHMDSTLIYNEFAKSKSSQYIFASFATCYAEAQFRAGAGGEGADGEDEDPPPDLGSGAAAYFSELKKKQNEAKAVAANSNGLLAAADSELLSLNAEPNLLCWGSSDKNTTTTRYAFYGGMYKFFNSQFSFRKLWAWFSYRKPACAVDNVQKPVKNAIGKNFEDRKVFTLDSAPIDNENKVVIIAFRKGGNGQGKMSDFFCDAGVPTALPPCQFTGRRQKKSRYVFSHWSTENGRGGEEYPDGGTICKTEDTRLYAIWIKPALASAAAFRSGSADTAAGKKILDTRCLGLAGNCEFATSDGETLHYAYATNEIVETFAVTVSFDGNGSTSGSVDPVGATLDGAWICPKCEFQRTDYAFAGYWASSPDGSGSQYAPDMAYPAPVSDFRVYAVWKPA